MTTAPEQLKAWRIKFESRYDLSQLGTVYDRYLNQDVREAWGNYVEAREDALTQIAELKAKLAGAEAEVAALKQGLHRADEKLAEVMPLAKFGAMVAKGDYLSDDDAIDLELKAGISIDTSGYKTLEYAPNIEATIEQLSKD
jgi:hypothetical protein